MFYCKTSSLRTRLKFRVLQIDLLFSWVDNIYVLQQIFQSLERSCKQIRTVALTMTETKKEYCFCGACCLTNATLTFNPKLGNSYFEKKIFCRLVCALQRQTRILTPARIASFWRTSLSAPSLQKRYISAVLIAWRQLRWFAYCFFVLTSFHISKLFLTKEDVDATISLRVKEPSIGCPTRRARNLCSINTNKIRRKSSVQYFLCKVMKVKELRLPMQSFQKSQKHDQIWLRTCYMTSTRKYMMAWL